MPPKFSASHVYDPADSFVTFNIVRVPSSDIKISVVFCVRYIPFLCQRMVGAGVPVTLHVRLKGSPVLDFIDF